MKPEIPPPIESPCPKSWHEMAGDAKRRFCTHCQLHVHNLSEMNVAERHAVLTAGGRQCVSYTTDAKGNLLTHARPNGLLTLLSRFRVGFIALMAAIIPFGLVSCATRTLGRIKPPADKSSSQTKSSDERRTTVGMIAPTAPK